MTLETLKILHGDLVAAESRECEQRLDLPEIIGPGLDALEPTFKVFLDKPGRKTASRDAVLSGKITIEGEEYEVSKVFQETALQVADELDLDELVAAQLVLDSQDEERLLGRSLRVCALIRFHQQRKYLLDCVRLLLELSMAAELPDDIEEWFGSNMNELILGEGPSSNKTQKLLPRTMKAMADIQSWIQSINERVAGATVLGHANQAEFREMVEFSRVSLVQQHEVLAVIACYVINRTLATRADFTNFLNSLNFIARYDYATVHYFPILGAFIAAFASTECHSDLETVRELDALICRHSDEEVRQLPSLHAALRAWWLAEYSGWYADDAAGSMLHGVGVDMDAEDKKRSKRFFDALKDGAFDMILAVSADVKSQDWQDTARAGIRQWLQRKAPSLPPDTPSFSDAFQASLASQVEIFIDAFISNLPDVLRKLRSEEDEQRQMNQAHEQDLDLERFLLIIAYTYDGRPGAAEAFWTDPESNLAGFLQWASRRASTPLVSAFCEMLQSLSEDEGSADSANEFLLDEGHHGAGKMRKTLSLTWAQIFRELEFFTNRIRDKSPVAPMHAVGGDKFANHMTETEPESAMMLECYLRLMTRLASRSEQARIFILDQTRPEIVDLLLQLISSLVPHRLRACAFETLAALLERKDLNQSRTMWSYVDSCVSGQFMPPAVQRAAQIPYSPAQYMESLFEEMSPRFEETSSFVQLITSLICLPDGCGPLNDQLPFPEELGISSRVRPGIDPYIDYAVGHIFAWRTQDAADAGQQRTLRYHCLELILTCLSTFNEDLIIFSHNTNLPVDSAVAVTDLKTYIALHPFSRVMGWMYDSNVMRALISSIHQDPEEVGNAAPDSPLMLSIVRGIEVLSKVLSLQATYVNLVRPRLEPEASPATRSKCLPVPNCAFASVEEGILSGLHIIADLGTYCGVGHADLIHGSLQLLEKISVMPSIVSSAQSALHGPLRRNKAMVALEENGDVDAIAGTLSAEIGASLDVYSKADANVYKTKVYILDFLYSCINATPNQPTIAHLLLGFQCESETLSVEPGSAFDQGNSLFHTLLAIPVELTMMHDEEMSGWLINLKYKAFRIFCLLWSSPLSASTVLEQLRENDLLFHLLLQGLIVQPNTTWDGQELVNADFLISNAAEGYVNFLAIRAMALEYMTRELCSVNQGRFPGLKRRIFDALGGQVVADGGGESTSVTSIFEFQDFLPSADQFYAEEPELIFYHDMDFSACFDDVDGSQLYNLDKMEELISLKRNLGRSHGHLMSRYDLAPMEVEEERIKAWARYINRMRQMNAYSHKVLRAWNRLAMVMTQTNEFTGTKKVSFVLQALQAILPSLELYSSDNPDAAFEFAQLARVLLFGLDSASMSPNDSDRENRSMGNLISDKLFQLFQICLSAIAKWSGTPALRTLYYSISCRYISNLLDHNHDRDHDHQGQSQSRGQSLTGRHRATNAVRSYAEKLLGVLCDDVGSGDPKCQTSALILLNKLVVLSRQAERMSSSSSSSDDFVVEFLGRTNFIGVLVDSLATVMEDWADIYALSITTATAMRAKDLANFHDAKLALLLQLCQTRGGATAVVNAGFSRNLERSGLFAADPDLKTSTSVSISTSITAIKTAIKGDAQTAHYELLTKTTRILAAAVLSRGAHNVQQARQFLEENRMLVAHVFKKAGGMGGTAVIGEETREVLEGLAEVLMVICWVTGFVGEDR